HAGRKKEAASGKSLLFLLISVTLLHFFNLQAVHDILYHRLDFEKYDHHEFPGVVSRTFLGPVFLSTVCSPLIYLLSLLEASKFYTQLMSCWRSLHGWGRGTGLSCLSTLVIIVFRSELSLYLGLMLLMSLLSRRLGILQLLYYAIPAGALSLALTVGIDSFFWNKLIWPEGQVLWYNTTLNKSSNWGISFTSLNACCAVLFVPLGLLDRRTRTLLLPTVGFILLYSFLPHKELRFILYTFPVLNIVAARGCSYILNNYHKYWMYKLGSLIVVGRGGVVCKSIASQMSHFLELNRNWRYDKREDIGPGHPDMKTYSYVLMEANATHIALLKDSHVPLAFIQGYSNMTLNAFWFPFFSITLGDKLLLLERVPDPEHPS
uniref:Mannosyltransferase n=1 Tax=Oncorhynchus mykiss TaxID=8022 RepID=A0A8C7S7V8_ONCMY